MSVFDASVRYQAEKTPLLVLAGKEYGSGSSRDWAAKGPRLLGVQAVIAESYERIHRSNLVGMGIVPLQFREGESASSLGLTGEEVFAIVGVKALLEGGLAEDASRQGDGGASRKSGHRLQGDACASIRRRKCSITSTAASSSTSSASSPRRSRALCRSSKLHVAA